MKNSKLSYVIDVLVKLCIIIAIIVAAGTIVFNWMTFNKKIADKNE